MGSYAPYYGMNFMKKYKEELDLYFFGNLLLDTVLKVSQNTRIFSRSSFQTKNRHRTSQEAKYLRWPSRDMNVCVSHTQGSLQH